jgi:hypothetical protein
MPSIINPVAIAWKTLIDSLRTVAARVGSFFLYTELRTKN